MMSPIVMRGSSAASGSWKTICIARRRRRSASPPSAARSSPSQSTRPAVGSIRRRIARPRVDLPQPRLADDAERLAGREAKLTPSTALSGTWRRRRRPPCRDREVDAQLLDREQRGAHAAAPASRSRWQALRRSAAKLAQPRALGGAALEGEGAAVAERAARRQRLEVRRLAGDRAQLLRRAPRRAAASSRAAPACRGAADRRTIGSTGASSTIRPAYITSTRSREARDHAEVVGDQHDRHAESRAGACAAARGSAPAR